MNPDPALSRQILVRDFLIAILADFFLAGLALFSRSVSSWVIWVIALGLVLLAGLAFLFRAYQHNSRPALWFGLLNTVAVVAIFYSVFTYRPWCNNHVLALDVLSDNLKVRIISTGPVVVAPNTELFLQAIAYNETPKFPNGITCTWTYVGDIVIQQQGICFLHLKSGLDQDRDAVAVTVSQRFCGDAIQSLYIESQN